MLTIVDSLIVHGNRYALDRAVAADLPELIALLADDVLGAERESSDARDYAAAFREIDEDDHHLLLVVRDGAAAVIGTMQLSLIPGLSRGGTKRLQIEGVRLRASARGEGLGSALFAWAHEFGRSRGATLAQLSSDKSRTDAHRFYAALGYGATHEGFKRPL